MKKTLYRNAGICTVFVLVILSIPLFNACKTRVNSSGTEVQITQTANIPTISPTKTATATPRPTPTLEPTPTVPFREYPWEKGDTDFGTGEIPKLGAKYPIIMQTTIYEIHERDNLVLHKAVWKEENSVVLMVHNRGDEFSILEPGDIFVINSPYGIFTYSLVKKESYVKTGYMRYEGENELGEKNVIKEGDLASRIYIEKNQGLVLQSCIPSEDKKIEILFLTFKRVL